MFAIGFLLLVGGAVICNLFGSPFRNWCYDADYVGAAIALTGVCLMLASLFILAWRNLP